MLFVPKYGKNYIEAYVNKKKNGREIRKGIAIWQRSLFFVMYPVSDAGIRFV